MVELLCSGGAGDSCEVANQVWVCEVQGIPAVEVSGNKKSPQRETGGINFCGTI